MALLQIAEPGEAPAPHQHRLAVGIDLGTTNSLVATVRSGIPVVLPDENGRPLLPSIVRYGDDEVTVGYAAQDAQAQDPQNTIVSVKRLMGRALSDLSDVRRFPYHYTDLPGMVQIETRAGRRSVDCRSRRLHPGRRFTASRGASLRCSHREAGRYRQSG